jgi:hypothetical protein
MTVSARKPHPISHQIIPCSRLVAASAGRAPSPRQCSRRRRRQAASELHAGPARDVPDRQFADQLCLIEAIPLALGRGWGTPSGGSRHPCARACRSIASTARRAAAWAAAMPAVVSGFTVTESPYGNAGTAPTAARDRSFCVHLVENIGSIGSQSADITLPLFLRPGILSLFWDRFGIGPRAELSTEFRKTLGTEL